jgi:ATP-dependent Clp protease protease subunit
MGMTASMATIIASSGTKGKRFILPHTRFLIHQPLGNAKGQCSDIQIEAKEIQTLKEELTQILADNSGQDYETIEKMCDRDTILTAKQAVEYGFVDSVVMNKKYKILP